MFESWKLIFESYIGGILYERYGNTDSDHKNIDLYGDLSLEIETQSRRSGYRKQFSLNFET